MPLDVILETDKIVYLMSYKDDQCLLAETETSYSFKPCDATTTMFFLKIIIFLFLAIQNFNGKFRKMGSIINLQINIILVFS